MRRLPGVLPPGSPRPSAGSLDARAAADPSPLYRALGAADAPGRGRAAADLSHTYALFAAGHGAVRYAEVPGSTRDADGVVYAFARVGFEQGAELLRMAWYGGRLVRATAEP